MFTKMFSQLNEVLISPISPKKLVNIAKIKMNVKIAITPMLSTLSIMTLAEDGSEVEVLGLGLSIIALNIGMYFAAPTIVIIQIKKKF